MKKKDLSVFAVLTGLMAVILAWLLPSWAAAPFALYFSVFLPGLLIYLAIKHAFDFDWKALVNILGLGTAFLIFSTLLINWILRAIGIQKPLTHLPLTLGIVFFESLLLLFRFNWAQAPLKFKPLRLTLAEKISVTSATCILLCFIGGSIRLNNGANGWLSALSYIAVPLLFSFCIWQIKNIRNGVLIYTLWMLGLGVLLSGCLRSSYISGPDISREYQVFMTIHAAGYWNIDLYRNVYNACLSVSLLPTSLAILTKLSGTVIFKLLVPLLYSFVIPIVYLITRNYFSKLLSISAAFFFFAQSSFQVWWWIPIRQEVAFLFFGLLILTMADRALSARARTGLFLIFIFSLVVSHYSTAYLTLVFFVLLLIWKYVVGNLFKFHISSKQHFQTPKPALLLIMFLAIFAWYSQITFGFGSVTQFTIKSFSNIGKIFTADNQGQGQSFFDQLNIFSHPGQSVLDSNKYVKDSIQSAQQTFGAQNLYNTPDTTLNTVDLDASDSGIVNGFTLLRRMAIVLGKILIIGGVIVTFYLSFKDSKLKPYALLSSTGLIIMALTIIVPLFSIQYDQVRTFQQLLFVFSACIGVIFFRVSYKGSAKILLALFMAIYFITIMNVPLAPSNTLAAPVSLRNYGSDYNFYYVHKSDFSAVAWLNTYQQALNTSNLVADSHAQHKLNLVLLPKQNKNWTTLSQVMPSVIPKNSVIFSDYANKSTQAAFTTFSAGNITYSYPFQFIQSNKNTVYSNGADNIYR